jgi:ribosomal-protein-alanine N-acetyltransferase
MTPPIGFLRPRKNRKGALIVRKAEPTDLDAVETIAQTSSYAYTGLGGAMQEALYHDIVLTAWQGGEMAGFVMAHHQGPKAAWLHAFGAAPDVSLSETGRTLLEEVQRTATRRGITWLGYMDEYGLPWLRNLLEDAGFRPHGRVIGFEAPLVSPPTAGAQWVQIRPALRRDIPAIARLDQEAFAPVWAYKASIFGNVLDQVASFFVAEGEGELVGYILITQYQKERAHVVRLAIQPQRQGQGVGARLLAEAFAQLRRRGLQRISLNTQEDNLRSQRLYHRFGFRHTGKFVRIWAKEVGEKGPSEQSRPVS